jgi:hypothetical protein
VTDNARLVQRRRGARRRSKLKLVFQLAVSLIFLGTAVLLSAGMVQVVERPVPPWKPRTTIETVSPVAEAAPVAVDPSDGSVERAPVDRVDLAGAIDPQQAQVLLREARIDDLPEPGSGIAPGRTAHRK